MRIRLKYSLGVIDWRVSFVDCWIDTDIYDNSYSRIAIYSNLEIAGKGQWTWIVLGIPSNTTVVIVPFYHRNALALALRKIKAFLQVSKFLHTMAVRLFLLQLTNDHCIFSSSSTTLLFIARNASWLITSDCSCFWKPFCPVRLLEQSCLRSSCHLYIKIVRPWFD